MGKKEEYAAKFRDPKWQKKRLEILSRDEFSCQLCFDDQSTLHVHHRWYKWGNDPWDYPDSALVTLCESCHTEESENLPDAERDLVLILKQGGATSREFHELSSAFTLVPEKPMWYVHWDLVAFVIRELFLNEQFWQWARGEMAKSNRAAAEARLVAATNEPAAHE